jgi:hypothetical protein
MHLAALLRATHPPSFLSVAVAIQLALVVSLAPAGPVRAAASNLEITPAAGTWIAGTAKTVTVTAHNPDHTVDAAYTGVIHFTSEDAHAVLPADYAFTAADAGGHSFSVTLRAAGSIDLNAWDVPAGAISGSVAITVVPAAASVLAFAIEPTGGVVDRAFIRQPVVVVEDAYHNIATSSTAAITLTMDAAASVFECKTANPANAYAGVAQWAGCRARSAASDVRMTASSPGLTSAETAAFDIAAAAPPGSSITFDALATLVVHGTILETYTTISSGGVHAVRLEGMDPGEYAWHPVGGADTDAAGTMHFTPVAEHNILYRVINVPDDALGPLESNVLPVIVRFSVALSPARLTTVAPGAVRTYSATVAPIVSGFRPDVVFTVYQRVGLTWVARSTTTVRVNRSGVAKFTRTWSKHGSWYVRARALATGYNAANNSNIAYVTVR